jgi:hypothetical protein
MKITETESANVLGCLSICMHESDYSKLMLNSYAANKVRMQGGGGFYLLSHFRIICLNRHLF